jgi:REP-associated tyrosine transposase
MIGTAAAPDWLETPWLLSAFSETESEAVAQHKQFVAEGQGRPSPWQHLEHQLFLGSDALAQSMQRMIPRDKDLREVPQAKAPGPARSLARYAGSPPERDAAIAAAYGSGGYRMKEIGDYFGLHYSRVSRSVQAAEQSRPKATVKT